MRYRLRTLMIVMAVGPPILAVAWWLNLAPIVAGLLVWTVAAIALGS